MMNIPKIDLHGKSFGEMIRDLEINGELGHFKIVVYFKLKIQMVACSLEPVIFGLRQA